MTLSHHVVAGARCIRIATLALAVAVLVGAASLQAFDLRYGHETPSSLRLRSAGTDLGAALVHQQVVTRWMPHLLR